MCLLFLEVSAGQWHSMNNQAIPLCSLKLHTYTQTASLIRLNGYEGSIASKLKKAIAGDMELCEKLLGIEENAKSLYNFSKSFVAIAAPSLEGKTQFAFILEKTRPLYFELLLVEIIEPNHHLILSRITLR